MAFPTILADSTNGAASDTACSGAGPTTALTGTAAASDGAGTTITLDSGTVLTGVDTTGLHALLFRDTTAGHRQFSTIIGTAGSGGATPTVTLREAVTISLSGKSWAIGGVRATVGGAVSALLLNNNGAAGDAMPGWAIEMQSGHSETLSATLIFRCSGNSTSGSIIMRGAAGAITLPLLIFSNNGKGLDLTTAALTNVCVRDFELQNTNATKTGSTAIDAGSSDWNNVSIQIIRLKIAHSTNKFNRAIIPSELTVIFGCEVGYTNSHGIDGNANAFSDNKGVFVGWNYVHDCGGSGIYMSNVGSAAGGQIVGNICYKNTSHGIRVDNAQATLVLNNTCDSNTGSGLFLTLDSGNFSINSVIAPAMVRNNIFSNNGAYGVNFNGATIAALTTAIVDCNDTYNNTSGAYSTSGVATNDPGLDPQFTNAAGGDFSIGTNLKAKGFPLGGTLTVGTRSSTYSYVDIGAAQRQETGGGGGGATMFIPVE